MSAELAAAGISGLGDLLRGKTQARYASRAAETTANATREAARLRAQGEKDQLAYLKAESEHARKQAEVDRRAGFDLSNVRDRNLFKFTSNALNNAYATRLAEARSTADQINALQANQRAMFDVTRGDENLLIGRQDARMSNLGEMLGQRPRGPLKFDTIAALQKARAFDPGPPVIDPREEPTYVPGYDPNFLSGKLPFKSGGNV
tara:strand:- start:1447 stop:2061 length:615 start_codon:yes stop_codon:yes gene_type:complete